MKTSIVNKQLEKAIEPLCELLLMAKDVQATSIERDIERVIGVLEFWRRQ